MKVSIGIFVGKNACGHLIKMIDLPTYNRYVLSFDSTVDTTRPHLFKFSEQDQFCRIITHEEYEAELTK